VVELKNATTTRGLALKLTELKVCGRIQVAEQPARGGMQLAVVYHGGGAVSRRVLEIFEKIVKLFVSRSKQ
jgi:hypothetical protein